MTAEKGFFGKLIYRPPERAYANAWLVETEHGYKVYLNKNDARPKSFIPHSAVKTIEWRNQ